MSLEGLGHNPEAQPNPYAQIPDLVRSSVLARPDRARRSQRELVKQIVSDPYSDPLVLAIAEAQEILISAKSSRQMKAAKELLGEIIHQGSGGDSPREELVFRVNQQLLDTSIRVAQNNSAIQEKRFLQRDLPPNYGFVNPFIRMQEGIKKELQQGAKEIGILQLGKGLSQQELDRLQSILVAHNQWEDSLREVTGTVKTDIISFNTDARDTLVGLLKSEPESTDIGREKQYSKKYAGVALEDIEQMSYPVSMEEWSEIANYLIASRLNMEGDPRLAGKADAITMLFFNSTPFNENIIYQNSRILGNINSWQESLVYYLAFQQNEEIDMQVKKLVQSSGNGIKFATLIAEYSRSPFITDPGITTDEKTQDLAKRHPLFADSASYYVDRHGKADVDSALDPIWAISEEYFREVLLPQLKVRALSLGISDRFDREISQLEGDILAEGHLKFIKAVFEKNCGQEYLEKLQTHSQEIEEVTISAWQEAIEKIHFLPMQQGENIIEFSEDSVPNIQGLESIMMTTVGSPQDWRIHVAFKPLNIPFEVHAYLTQEGKLEFLTPLQKEMPGLYTILNHIAVLTFHDLVVQERKEKEAQRQEPNIPEQDKRVDDKRDEDIAPRKSYSRNLPRVQQEKKLIADVYEATNRKPRTVELHKSPLGRRKNYLDAVALYQDEVQKRSSQEEINAAKEILEEARKRMYKISEGKRLNAPARFSLETKEDPVTKEQLYLETWTVEHTSPKPTPEELNSPVRLYQRYYRHSSALAFLDQMKPWFIGQ